MNEPVLCQVRMAETPFYIEEIDMNIFSAEELCYFLVHNVPLLDRSFFGAELQTWMKEELRVRLLANTLEKICGEEPFRLERAVFPILDEIHYLKSYDEKGLLKEIQEFDNMPLPMQMKQKADTFVSHRKYMKAIDLYQRILDMEGQSNLGSQFLGSIYNNMGVVYSRLFQLEEAGECMKEAYRRLHSQLTLKNYLFIVYLNSGREALHALSAELGVDDATVQDVEQRAADLKPEEKPDDVPQSLGMWVQDYHRATGL